MKFPHLRLACLPKFYTSTDLSGISVIPDSIDKVIGLSRHAPAFCHFYVPATRDHFRWDDAIFPAGKFEQIKTCETRQPRVVHPPPNLATLETMKSKWCYDFLLNHRYENSNVIANAVLEVPNRFDLGLPRRVVTYFTETWYDERLPHLRTAHGRQCVAASILAGPALVMTEIDRRALLDLLREFFRPAQVARAEAWLHVVPPCIDTSLVDERLGEYAMARATRRAAGVTHVFHGGSLEPKRHLPQMVQAAGDIAKIRKLRFVVKTQKEVGDPFQASHVDYEGGVNRAKYLDALGQGDILWCGSEYEGTGLAYMEAIRSGMAALFLDSPWIRERIPANYPFVVDRPEKIGDVLLHMIDHPAEAESAAKALRAFQGDRWSATSVGLGMLETLAPHLDQWRAEAEASLGGIFWFKLLREALEAERPARCTAGEATNLIAARTRTGKVSIRVYDLKLAMQVLGYQDACDAATPEFVRA